MHRILEAIGKRQLTRVCEQFWRGTGFLMGMSAGIAAAVSRPLVLDLDQGFRKVGLTAWSRFVLARVWLALTRKLPWRTMAFLQDAHRRHVLRPAGAVYRFRHDRLQGALEAAGRGGPGR
jgi:hypothetical protein